MEHYKPTEVCNMNLQKTHIKMEQHEQKCYVAILSFMSKTANKGGNIIVQVGGYFVFREDNSVFIEHAKLYVQTNPL